MIRQVGSSSFLTSMMEAIPDPVFFKDREGRYLIANAATAQSFKRDAIVGLTDYDLLPFEEAERLRAADLDVMNSGVPRVVEECLGIDGTHWYLSSKGPLRDETGTIIGIVGLARDITGRHEAEEQLRQAREQAEAANQAKATFLASASHDLRQPVQALVLFSSMLQSHIETDPGLQIFARMVQSLDAMQALLNSFLDISRLDAGLVAVTKEKVSLAPMMIRLCEEYGDLAQRQNLELRVVPCREQVHTDAALLEQVLRNIIENALRYTWKGKILMGCRRQGGNVILHVIDTGIGIARKDIERVFEEFRQLANPERDRMKGLGLGLPIVRRLLALMDHHLEVASEPGRGSSFSITLPKMGGPHRA